MNWLNLKLGKILGINLMICTLLLSGCSSEKTYKYVNMFMEF